MATKWNELRQYLRRKGFTVQYREAQYAQYRWAVPGTYVYVDFANEVASLYVEKTYEALGALVGLFEGTVTSRASDEGSIKELEQYLVRNGFKKRYYHSGMNVGVMHRYSESSVSGEVVSVTVHSEEHMLQALRGLYGA